MLFTLTSPHLQKMWCGEGEQADPRGIDGRTSSEGELTAMPPVLKVSFHFLPLLGLSHSCSRTHRIPLLEGRKQSYRVERNSLRAVEWPPPPRPCPDGLQMVRALARLFKPEAGTTPTKLKHTQRNTC